VHSPVVIPDLRRTVRHALPTLVEGKLIPLLLFVGLLQVAGTLWALLVSLAWSLGVVGVRAAGRRRITGIVIIGTVTLAARTVAALLTGSMVVYFLQPTITTVVVGFAFLISVPLGRPLAERLAFDVLPFDDETRRHPLVRAFFRRMSLVWAMTSLVNASITIWLLLTQSTTTFVLVKSVLGPATAVVTIAPMLVWLRVRVARSGTPIVWTRATRTMPAIA
jgi:hypothetical protein